MNSVIDLAERRRRLSGHPPTRPCDFELQVWLDDKQEVDWTWLAGPFLDWSPDADHRAEHRKRVAALVDSAWLYAKEGGHESLTERDRPLVWYLLDGNGSHTYLYPREIDKNTGFKHFVWFVRQWWRVTKWWARMAIRVARGRG